MGHIKDNLLGKKFNRLTVVRMFPLKIRKVTAWECICDCGKITKVIGYKLKNGHTKSCGCYGQEMRNKSSSKANTVHGMNKTRPHRCWKAMMSRCNYKGNVAYHNYGGRGIIVCNEWKEFKNFWKDMKDTYSDNLTIDRVDNNGNYCKENCKWSTYKEQSANRRQPRKRKN